MSPRPPNEARDADRFWSKVTSGDGGCWIWTAALVSGYGRFHTGARKDGTRRGILAHRWAYESLRAEIPDGLFLDHLCRNRACVNPWHLEPVTNQVNNQRGLTGHASGARQRAITRCPAGHAYDDENTYVDRRGKRFCRACKREWWRAHHGKGVRYVAP
jgi:hypothetical protein